MTVGLFASLTTDGTGVDLAVFFAIGLLGGAHCLGMCGPLVTLYSESMAAGDRADSRGISLFELRQHGLFNVGRTVSYAFVGGALGLLGHLFFSATTAVHVGVAIRSAAGLLAGAFICSVGVYRVTGASASPLSTLPFSMGFQRAFQRLYGAITARIDRLASGTGIVGLGAMHALLPCPLLYPAFIYAFAASSPLHGAVDLAALGVGTFPTMFLYGTVLGSLDVAQRTRLHRALGVAFLVLGYIPLSMSLNMLGIHVPMLRPPFYQPLG